MCVDMNETIQLFQSLLTVTGQHPPCVVSDRLSKVCPLQYVHWKLLSVLGVVLGTE
jgi:hypothetical protein